MLLAHYAIFPDYNKIQRHKELKMKKVIPETKSSYFSIQYSYPTCLQNYSSRIASIGFIFIALLAGINPAKVPITSSMNRAATATLKLICGSLKN